MRTLTALDLRKKLGAILDDVANNREQIIISRANKPLAVIISIDEYEEKVVRKNRGQKLKNISAKMDEWKKKHRKDTAHVDVVDAIRAMRESR